MGLSPSERVRRQTGKVIPQEFAVTNVVFLNRTAARRPGTNTRSRPLSPLPFEAVDSPLVTFGDAGERGDIYGVPV